MGEKFDIYDQIDQYWLGGVKAGSQWVWLGGKHNMENFTAWHLNMPGYGCQEPCNGSIALIASKADNHTWFAEQMDNEFPYVCQSKCSKGFIWYKSVQKCLRILDTPMNMAEAVLSCRKEKGKLLSVESCSIVDELNQELQANDWSGSFLIGLYHLPSSSTDHRRNKDDWIITM